jgi:hypothetical protein
MNSLFLEKLPNFQNHKTGKNKIKKHWWWQTPPKKHLMRKNCELVFGTKKEIFFKKIELVFPFGNCLPKTND